MNSSDPLNREMRGEQAKGFSRAHPTQKRTSDKHAKVKEFKQMAFDFTAAEVTSARSDADKDQGCWEKVEADPRLQPAVEWVVNNCRRDEHATQQLFASWLTVTDYDLAPIIRLLDLALWHPRPIHYVATELENFAPQSETFTSPGPLVGVIYSPQGTP
ncbi:hypothetical protein FHS85_001530 [Rhodoligotrophos appendicifer]|uniref:hypothetical protein n=1 Tax=Rhodoligotrophos appendicifer TaxID=987056 RepID=UPI001184930D|nr:hypothetical protein [Rhodoligotrophos appendicifer]